jgi:hypothetical protein
MSRGLGTTQRQILWTLFSHYDWTDRDGQIAGAPVEQLARMIYHPPAVRHPSGSGHSNGPVTSPMKVAARRAVRGLAARGLIERSGRTIRLTDEGRSLMKVRQRREQQERAKLGPKFHWVLKYPG